MFWHKENDYSDNFQTAEYKGICSCLKLFYPLLQIMKRIIATLITKKSTSVSVEEKKLIPGKNCRASLSIFFLVRWDEFYKYVLFYLIYTK